MITKETFAAAPAWAVFHGETADPGPIFWGLFDINPGDYGFVEDPAHDLEALGVDFIEPELDDNHGDEQPPGADDLDAALAYLRRGGTLCKVPDAPGSSFWRLLVVGKPVPAHEFKIEARTKAGPIVWQPYASHAVAEKALPALKKQAKALGVVRGSWQIAAIQGQAETAPSATASATTLALARALEGKRLQVGPWTARMFVAPYDSGEVAIELVDVWDGETIASLTVNSGGRAALGEGEILLKTWGEADLVLEPALASGYFEDTGRRVPLGNVAAAVWRIRSSVDRTTPTPREERVDLAPRNWRREIKPPSTLPLDLLGAIEALFIDGPYFPLRIGDRIDVIGGDDVVLAAIRMRENEAVVEQVGSGVRAAKARLQVATWLSARIARAKKGRVPRTR